MLAAVKLNEDALHCVPDELTFNYEFQLSAVKENGLALRLFTHYGAVENPRPDKTFSLSASNEGLVSATVKQNGLALQLASFRLRNSKQVVLVAVTQNAGALKFAFSRLRNSK